MLQKRPDIEEIASRILADYDAAQPASLFVDGLRLDLTDAWRL